jgi:monoamine oxidase
MQRRNFLKSIGIVATGSLLSQSIANEDFDRPLQKGEKVLILGAGISGLAAAYQLQKKGISFQVLEARNRIGGRIFTNLDSSTQLHTEMGAEWIGASHSTLINLCKSLDVKLIPHQFEENYLIANTFYQERNASVAAEWQEKYKFILENYKKLDVSQIQKLDKISWWRYLKKKDIPEIALIMRELADSTDFGESIRNISAFSALSEYAYSSPKNEMDFIVEGGNTKLIERLAQKVGTENIFTNKTATKVNQHRNKVEIICKNGEKFEANRLICTLPTYALSQIDWQPALPSEKIMALEQLQYGRIIKTQVFFSQRFWKEDNFSVMTDTLAHLIFHTTQNQRHSKGVLTSYCTGDKAEVLAQMNEQQKIKVICDALKPIFGDVMPYAEKATSYYWGTDMYSQGAYAAYNVGQIAGKNPLQKILAKPFENTLFVGEYLADWQGFMEGAAQTGIDAADLLAH